MGSTQDTWLVHLRWAIDHVDSNLQALTQSLWALTGLQGVTIALIAQLVGSAHGTARWLAFASMCLVTAGACISLAGSAPRPAPSINPTHYRKLWAESMPEGERASLAGDLVEEILQSAGDPSPLEASVALAAKRGWYLRLSAAVTVVGLLVLAVAALVLIVSPVPVLSPISPKG